MSSAPKSQVVLLEEGDCRWLLLAGEVDWIAIDALATQVEAIGAARDGYHSREVTWESFSLDPEERAAKIIAGEIRLTR